MRKVASVCMLLLGGIAAGRAQTDGSVIINEIANSGTKTSAYTGGEYVELLVVQAEGVKMAGWYLTDMSNPGSEPKQDEGWIRFSDSPWSVFTRTIPSGTYILICFGEKDMRYGSREIEEDATLDDGNNRLVLFAYGSPEHINRGKGLIGFTGRDNIALLTDWAKDAAVDIVTWEGASMWEGAMVTELPQDMVNNGKIIWFAPYGFQRANFVYNSYPGSWRDSESSRNATPGARNADVIDTALAPPSKPDTGKVRP